MFAAQDLSLLLVLSLSAFAAPACAPTSAEDFLTRTITINGASHGYRVYVPSGWTKEKAWPVILYLHGAGERGNDNLTQTRIGLGPALRRGEGFPCVVVMPQCLRNRWWPEAEMQAIAIKALDEAIAEFNGDPERVYLTGISMGGYGTWALARSNPGRFAALAPVCGGVRPPASVPIPPAAPEAASSPDPYAAVAEKVGRTPTWIFHGSADAVVPVTESRKMAEALKAIGNPVRYSEYEGVAHNSWDRAYAEPELVAWLLAQRRQKSA